ncbi:DUF4296 domain-containing protein [Hymenobacter taeanensis]|uniref:DUF4296 domain-containing protein n=1 Tax=Hymenobacter taeanensis TaxID=2735321 RepID=A0A6M6BDS1_9BACT|nr:MULTISPECIES: DUF4296 domain-containing protein [Hymenobacter]QJX45433.1 DUF4296 domain-containing protein [Hymenobacter taeanensis]UOQ81323.1 DUF4296 domain-containing protein [Hymenobacter sp. 5414T-23]
MKNTFLYLLLILGAFLAGCQKPEDVAPPSKLLPQEKMVSLLVNIHILEAQVDASALPSDSARALFLQQQKVLFKRYEVTDSSFRQSYRYYAVHDKDLDDIYKIVIDSLGKREKKFGITPDM